MNGEEDRHQMGIRTGTSHLVRLDGRLACPWGQQGA